MAIYTIPELQKTLRKAYKRLNNWRAVGKDYGITGGMAYRIAHGYEPKDPRIRTTLHLPALVPAPVCPRCGVVHVSKRCTQKRSLPEPWESAVQWLAEREKARKV